MQDVNSDAPMISRVEEAMSCSFWPLLKPPPQHSPHTPTLFIAMDWEPRALMWSECIGRVLKDLERASRSWGGRGELKSHVLNSVAGSGSFSTSNVVFIYFYFKIINHTCLHAGLTKVYCSSQSGRGKGRLCSVETRQWVHPNSQPTYCIVRSK